MVAGAGVTIALGGDTSCGPGLFGTNTSEEIELMVAAGPTPAQSLLAGTSAAARQCARKRADLILLTENPTADVGNIRTLGLTVSTAGSSSTTDPDESATYEFDMSPRRGG